MNEIAHQKDLDKKEQEAKNKKQSNKKEKNLVTIKQGKVDARGVDIDDYGSEEENYDDYSDEDEYAKYEK